MTDGDGLEVERIVNRLQSVDISDDRAESGYHAQDCEGIGRSRGSWGIYWGPGNEVNEDGNYVGSIFYPEPTFFGSTPGDFLVALSSALSTGDNRFKFVGIEMNDALVLIEAAIEASDYDFLLSDSLHLYVNDGYVEFDNGKVTYRE